MAIGRPLAFFSILAVRQRSMLQRRGQRDDVFATLGHVVAARQVDRGAHAFAGAQDREVLGLGRPRLIIEPSYCTARRYD
jgi:hypothetical protein